jgi:hypothetical protein
MSAAARDPDPAMLAIRRGLGLLHEADAGLFWTRRVGSRTPSRVATKDVGSNVAAEARRLADRLSLLYPLGGWV